MKNVNACLHAAATLTHLITVRGNLFQVDAREVSLDGLLSCILVAGQYLQSSQLIVVERAVVAVRGTVSYRYVYLAENVTW